MKIINKGLSIFLIATMVVSTSFSVLGNEIPTEEYPAIDLPEEAEDVDTYDDYEDFDNYEELQESEDLDILESLQYDDYSVFQKSFQTSFNNFATNYNDNFEPIQDVIPEEIISENIEITEETVYDGEDLTDVGITPYLSNRYYWNFKTAAFEPSKMESTTDIDIVWDRYVTGNVNEDFQPMGYPALGTSTFVAGENQSVYTTRVNQGHVNDYLAATEFGSHSYVTSLTGSFDTITVLASKKVRVRIADMQTMSWVYDSGTNGVSFSPAAGGDVMYYSTASTTSYGATKDVSHVRFNTGQTAKVYCVVLSPYDPYYPTSFDDVDNLDPTYHYAFFTGQALPAKGSISNISAHNSAVSYNGVGSFNSAVTGIQFTTGLPASRNDLYAMRSITVKEYVSSKNNQYLSSLSYQFKWPDQSSFYSLSGSPDTYTYTFNPSYSPVGAWQFKFNGSWTDARNSYNYFSGRTHMAIDYLAPYGYLVK